MFCSPELGIWPKGFTLIEILTVLAIVGVLAAIAVPTYEASVIKGRRADGQGFALDLAAREELYFLRHGHYTGDLSAASGLGTSVTSPEGFYRASVAACAGGSLVQCYRLTVTALGVQRASDLACVSLTITNTGRRGSVDSAGKFSREGESARCW